MTLVFMAACASARAAEPALADLSLEELGDVRVTSVSKAAEPLSQAPAAIYVITQEDIRRSGVQTLVEALRLAPNLRVSQLGSSDHVVSTRGFGGAQEAQNFSNKLLMLIDGRSVYSPLFSGIHLDSQDVLLDDVSRIEVISGPGATLWGANAVHGVINVITRPAYLTEGSLLSAAAGNDEQSLAMRHGGSLGGNGAYRAWAKLMRRDAMDLDPDTSAADGWRRAQAGFRMDGTRGHGNWTLQGDAYRARHERAGADAGDLTGANVVARWEEEGERSRLQVQAWFDHVQRETRLQEAVRINTVDLEVQHDVALGARHSLVWGAGGRVHHYRIRNSAGLRFLPTSRDLQLWNLFAQDTITLAPDVRLTLGLKLEHNDFTGWEPQPELRLAWQASDRTLLWAAGARAIRAPTPFDTDVNEYLGDTLFVVGDPQFRSEEVFAYDAGVRLNLAPALTLSASAFFNRYDHLRTVEWGPAPTMLPLRWDNAMHGDTWGINAWASWQLTPWWRLSPGFELLRRRLRFDAGSSSPLGVDQAGNDPRGHARLTSSMDLASNQMFEVSLRHVGRQPAPELPAYTELSARYAWQANRNLELSVRGVNLLHRRHREYPAGNGALIRRGVMAEARWRR